MQHSVQHPSDHAPIAFSEFFASEAQTQRFAEKMALRIQTEPHLCRALVYLEGDLGAGKTSFVRHLLRALGEQGRIKSPSYSIAESYHINTGANTARPSPCTVWHCDFYRFQDPAEWEAAGLREIFASNSLKLIEWPSMAAGLLPTPDLSLTLARPDSSVDPALAGQPPCDEARLFNMRAYTPIGLGLLGKSAGPRA